jgi:hypothetical protein
LVTELETPPKPEVSKPEVSKPEVSKPEVYKPEVYKPEVYKPETQPILPGNKENTDKQQLMPHASTPKCEDQEIQKIIDKLSIVFVGEGKLNTQEVGLHINENIKPVVQPQRRILYHIRNDVSKALQKLVVEDMIEKVCDQPNPWISPTVCTPKKDGGTRICVDMRAAKQAIKRERHIMPTLSDLRAEMNGSKYFSKIDLKQAYHQLELKEESRYITTFSTHKGLFCYKRQTTERTVRQNFFRTFFNKTLVTFVE